MMRISCSTSCLPTHTLADALREIRAAGYAAVEVSAIGIEEAFGQGEDASRRLRDLLARDAVTLSSMTGAILAAESSNEMPANVQALCRHLRLARRLGLVSVNVGAGDRKRQDFDVLIAGLREAASYAGRLGMQINLANRRDSRIEQLQDLRYVLANLPAETARILVDCGEFHSAAVNPCHAFREFAGQVGIVRVADRIGKRSVPLGQGEMNVPAIIEMAHRCGYDGWLVVTAEPPDGGDPVSFLADARVFLEQQPRYA
jgi:sugar phosphate isomerase/epimerase